MVIDVKRGKVFFLEFERSTDRKEGGLKVKEAAANEQHNIIIEVLRAVATE